MESDTSSWMILFRTLGSLILVLGLIFVLSKFARKYLHQKNWAPENGIRILQSFSLEPKKKLLVVEVEDQKLLLGLAENSISCLCHLPKESHKKAELKNVVV